MKNLVYILMGLAMVVLTACETDAAYDERDFALNKKPAEPTPEPTTPKDSVNWGTPVKNTLLPYGEPEPATHMWHGRLVFYASQNDSLVRTAEMPVGYSLTPSEGFSYSKTGEEPIYAGQKTFIPLASNTSYGEWKKDAEGNMLRKVTYTFHCPTTEFAKTLTVSRFDGYCELNGRQHDFKYHSVKIEFLALDLISSEEVEGEDTVYIDKTYELSYRVTFTVVGLAGAYHSYVVKAQHTVRYFVRLKEKPVTDPTTTPATPSNWVYVAATLAFNPNIKFSNEKKCTGSFSEVIVLKNTVTRQWGLAIRNYKDTKFNLYKFSFDEYPERMQINSAIWNSRWEPARVSGSDPWYYYGKTDDIKVGMYMTDADINGIRNFTGESTAECSPYLSWTHSYAADGSLQVINKKGFVVFTIK